MVRLVLSQRTVDIFTLAPPHLIVFLLHVISWFCQHKDQTQIVDCLRQVWIDGIVFYCTAQYSTTQNSTIQNSVIQHSTEMYSAI